jgi:hypothetical protein
VSGQLLAEPIGARQSEPYDQTNRSHSASYSEEPCHGRAIGTLSLHLFALTESDCGLDCEPNGPMSLPELRSCAVRSKRNSGFGATTSGRDEDGRCCHDPIFCTYTYSMEIQITDPKSARTLSEKCNHTPAIPVHWFMILVISICFNTTASALNFDIPSRSFSTAIASSLRSKRNFDSSCK